MYFVDSAPASSVHGGSKAKADIAEIFRRQGSRPLPLGGAGGLKKLAALLRVATLAACGRRTTVVMNFPSYNPSAQLAMRLLARRHRLVLLVHDVDQARDVAPTQQLAVLSSAAACIVTGDLARLPAVTGLMKSVVQLAPWDYLLPPAAARDSGAVGDIVMFAGTLDPAKSPWLYVPRTMPLVVAGTGFDAARAIGDDRYVGPFTPNQPEFPVDVGWGLVWDGDSPDTLSGPTGLYQLHNQPHKFSLYLASGLPVICSRQAAVARLVASLKLGICVDRVDEIPAALAAISADERNSIREAVGQVGAKIRNGDYLAAAIRQVVSALGDA